VSLSQEARSFFADIVYFTLDFFLGLQTGYIVPLFVCAARRQTASWKTHPPSSHKPPTRKPHRRVLLDLFHRLAASVYIRPVVGLTLPEHFFSLHTTNPASRISQHKGNNHEETRTIHPEHADAPQRTADARTIQHTVN
jgi:hypothetical protein